jgi:choline dehydrogenase-like flavoprotein
MHRFNALASESSKRDAGFIACSLGHRAEVVVLGDARKILPGATIRTEVCVIGAGAAGITAAIELDGFGRDVVLLEGGGLDQERTSQETYRGRVIGDTSSNLHPPLDSVRQKRLGGTTGSWGGRCIPLDPIDFEQRDYLPGSGWPIGLADLGPYYRSANRYCEVGNDEYTSETAFPGAPKFLLEPGQHALFRDDKVLRYSKPTDFGKAYRERLRASRRVQVLLHANTLRLDTDQRRQAVISAVVASAPGREFRVEARSFILAAGGLETTRLLLVTRKHSRTDLGGRALGHYYMTHLDGYVGALRFLGPVPPAAYSYDRSHDGVYCRRLICLNEQTLRDEGLLNFSAVLYMPAPDDPSHGDGLLSAFALAKEMLYRAKLGFKSRRHGLKRPSPPPVALHLRNIVRDPFRLPSFATFWMRERLLARRKIPSFLTESKSGEYRFLFSAEQSPSYANRLQLDSQPDRFGISRLLVEWNVSVSDHESIIRALSIIGSELKRLGIASVATPATPEELAASIGGGFLGGTHAMGTARMSRSPKEGVVDPDGRVHGLHNAFVASSAVFPTGGFGAPTLTIVALSIRTAKKIHEALRQLS